MNLVRLPQSKLIPILEPEFVADSAVNATMANQEMFLLPWWSMFLIMLKVVTVTKPLCNTVARDIPRTICNPVPETKCTTVTDTVIEKTNGKDGLDLSVSVKWLVSYY